MKRLAWNSSSWVVTMFSISELAFASWSESVSIRIAWSGMLAARPQHRGRFEIAGRGEWRQIGFNTLISSCYIFVILLT